MRFVIVYPDRRGLVPQCKGRPPERRQIGRPSRSLRCYRIAYVASQSWKGADLEWMDDALMAFRVYEANEAGKQPDAMAILEESVERQSRPPPHILMVWLDTRPALRDPNTTCVTASSEQEVLDAASRVLWRRIRTTARVRRHRARRPTFMRQEGLRSSNALEGPSSGLDAASPGRSPGRRSALRRP